MTNARGPSMYVSIAWDSLSEETKRVLVALGIGRGTRVSITKRVPIDHAKLRSRFETLLFEFGGKRTAAFAALAKEVERDERQLRRLINGK